MKGIHRILAVAAVSTFLLSCGNSSTEKPNQPSETATHAKHDHGSETASMELNNGAKWKVNDEMMVHVVHSRKLIADFSVSEEKDYNGLAEQLKKDNNSVISTCTMKDQAHDELHKWLLPHMDLVKALSEAEDETEAAKQFEKIQASFSTFNQYFE